VGAGRGRQAIDDAAAHGTILTDGGGESLPAMAIASKNGKSAIAVANPYPFLALYLGSYYNEAGQSEDALRVLTLGLTLFVTDGDTHLGRRWAPLMYERGTALIALKRFDEVLAVYDELLKQPDLDKAIQARIGVGQGDLPLGRLLHLRSDLVEALDLCLDPGNLVFEMGDLAFGDSRWLAVRPVELRHVVRDAFLQLLDARLELTVGKVLVAVVHRLELAPADRDDRLGEELQLPAQDDELPAHGSDRRTIVLSEVRNRLEVRHQLAGQPNQLNIALGLALQAPARLDPIAIAVDVDLEQHRRVVGRPACGFGLHALEGADRVIE